MAISITTSYSPRINAPNANYPTGSIKDETTPGFSNDGTPLTNAYGNDYVGFTDALLALGNVTRSNSPDTALQSDRLDAMVNVIADMIGLIPVSGGGTLLVDKRYLIMDDGTYTLPDTTGLVDKTSVYIVRFGSSSLGATTPTIVVDGTNAEQVEYYTPSDGVINETDTSVIYNISAPLTFLYNETSGNWEL